MTRPAHRDDFVLEPLIAEEELSRGVSAMVDALAAEIGTDELHVIGLLRGSFMFMADLVRQLHRCGIPLVVDFMAVSSYGDGTVSSGEVTLTRDLDTEIRGERVLLVDDILDTGRTLDFAKRHLRQQAPALLKTCVFLDKPSRRIVPCVADHVCFTVPDRFVVGYGLDYDGRFRELPYLGVVAFR